MYIVSWGRKEAGLAALSSLPLLGGVLYLSVEHSAWWALALPPLLAFFGLLILFFRNPSRRVASDSGLLVSPADGTVWDIARVDEGEFIQAPCIRVGIFLSLFDVHVNRAPAGGRIEWVCHREGTFHDARSEAARRENESNSIGMVRDDTGGPEGVRLLVKQIAGAIARRIICPLGPGAVVARGGLLGMIKYGSRTELYIPEASGVEIRVKVGDKVRGGSTVVAAWPPRAEDHASEDRPPGDCIRA